VRFTITEHHDEKGKVFFAGFVGASGADLDRCCSPPN